MHVLLKKITIAIEFIVAVAVLNVEAILLNTDRYIPANQTTIGYCKFEELKVI